MKNIATMLLITSLFFVSCTKTTFCTDPTYVAAVVNNSSTDTSYKLEVYTAGSLVDQKTEVFGSNIKIVKLAWGTHDYQQHSYLITLFPSRIEYTITNITTNRRKVKRANNDSWADNPCYNQIRCSVNGKEHFFDDNSDYSGIYL